MVRGQKPVPAVRGRGPGAVPAGVFSAVVFGALLLGRLGGGHDAPPSEQAHRTVAPPPLLGVEVDPSPFRLAHTLALLPADPEPALEPLMPEAEPAPPPAPPPPAPNPPPAPPAYPVHLPVAGIAAADLTDSFDARRSGGRTHRAIDIMAPTGTPVLAAVDGHVVRTHESALGGLSVYQVGPDSAWVFYYAHLDAYAPGLEPGRAVTQGDTLGFVGMTGNAPVPHLHFAVWKVRPGSSRLWGGRAINPYPLLTR